MYAQAEKAEIQAEIGRLREPRRTSGSGMPPFDETAFIHGLVGQYLSHDGYVESARAFSEEVNEEASALANDNNAHISYVPPEDDLDAINRQKIRAAILEGDIDKALKHTNAYYPSVLRDNENIYFKLRCRKFIEMIRRNNELTAQVHYLASSSPSKRSHASHSHSQSHNDEYDFEMELDEQLGVHHSPPTQLDPDLSPNPHSDTTTTYNPNDSKSREDSADDEESAQARLNKLTEETIQYGVILKQEFAADPRREVKRALEDTFALIAYENVVESHLAPLLEEAGRVPVAEELNSAILGMSYVTVLSEFHRTYANTIQCRWERVRRRLWSDWCSRRKRWLRNWGVMVGRARLLMLGGIFCSRARLMRIIFAGGLRFNCAVVACRDKS